MVSFKAWLDYPSKCFKTLTQIEVRHSGDGLGLWLSGAPFGKFWFSLRYRFVIDKLPLLNQKLCKIVSFQSLCRDRFWQQVPWSEVRALGLLRASLGRWAFAFGGRGPLVSHPTSSKTMRMKLLYKPNWLRKTTTPVNIFQLHHLITLSLYVVHRIAFHSLGNMFHRMTSHAKVSA